MAVVIDDRLLLDLLAGHPTPMLASQLRSGEVFTTSSWYYRLGRATFDDARSGALSGRLASFDQRTTERVRTALIELPASIGLLHPRVVVPVMFTLRGRVHKQLNLLGAEALAVALIVPARLLVTTDAPLLRAAAHDTGIEYQLTS